jgi:hypothetical protein
MAVLLQWPNDALSSSDFFEKAGLRDGLRVMKGPISSFVEIEGAEANGERGLRVCSCGLSQQTFLLLLAAQGAFFIFDNLIESETADPAECPLFFHPASMPVNLQSFLLGYVSAMAVFVEGFGSSLSVIQLQRSKMAVKKVEGVTLVLVGRSSESDQAVRQHLEDVYNAFCFFYGSIGAVMSVHGGGTRGELLKAMRRVGEELLPLIDNYNVTPFSSFDPLPYTVLRPHSTRVVVRAAQLLSSVSFGGHLGGAIFCATPGPGLCSVVATALPVDATRWVGVRVSHVADSMALGGRGTAAALPDDALLNSQCDLLNVMISTELRDQLRAEAGQSAQLLQGEEWGTGLVSAVSSSSSSASLKISSSSQTAPLTGHELLAALNLPPVPPGSCYAGLLIVYVGSLSAALLMELDLLYDEQHMQRVRTLCDARLVRLEQEMRALQCLGPLSSPSSESADTDTMSSSGGGASSMPLSPSSSSGSLPDATPFKVRFIFRSCFRFTLSRHRLIKTRRFGGGRWREAGLLRRRTGCLCTTLRRAPLLLQPLAWVPSARTAARR